MGVLYDPNLDDSECVFMSSKRGYFVQSIFSLLHIFQNWMIRMSNLDDLNMLVSHPKEDVLPVYNPNLDDSQCVIQTFLKMLESLSKLNYIQRTNTHSNTIILSLKTIVQSL